MNINRKQAFIKRELIKASIAIAKSVAALSHLPPFILNGMRYSSYAQVEARMHRIRCGPADPFDVLDVTQAGYIPPLPMMIGPGGNGKVPEVIVIGDGETIDVTTFDDVLKEK